MLPSAHCQGAGEIGKGPVPVVAIHAVGRARKRRRKLQCSPRGNFGSIEVMAHVKIKVSIVIVVDERAGERNFVVAYPGSGGDILKAPLTEISKQTVPTQSDQVDVGQRVVVIV